MSSKSRAMDSTRVLVSPGAHAQTSRLEQVRQAEGESRIICPKRLCLRLRYDRRPTDWRDVIRLRITDRVHPILHVAADLPTPTRNDSNPTAPGECKAGAELEPA